MIEVTKLHMFVKKKKKYKVAYILYITLNKLFDLAFILLVSTPHADNEKYTFVILRVMAKIYKVQHIVRGWTSYML